MELLLLGHTGPQTPPGHSPVTLLFAEVTDLTTLRTWSRPLSTVPEGNSRDNPKPWAHALGVSVEALALCNSSDTVDLHIDSFIWKRLFGYNIAKEHTAGPLPGFFARQVDVPRLTKVGINSAVWIVTTNPCNTAAGRLQAVKGNVLELRKTLNAIANVRVVRNIQEYREARNAGCHAAFLGIQGGNAFDASLDIRQELSHGWVLRITLVHLSNSQLGKTSAPSLGAGSGLTRRGEQLVEALNDSRVFVDLAHIDRAGFQTASQAHHRDLPLLVSHTGVSAIHPHWRNLDDSQLKTIAAFHGTVGIMYHSQYLGDGLFGGRVATVFRHLRHVVETIGDQHASLGSDWDGAIITPRDMPTCLELPRLVQLMLDAQWKPERINAVMGGNFLRCINTLRPPTTQ